MVHSVVDDADFKNQLAEAGDKLVVVDFMAVWCGPCKMIAPKLQEMSDTMDDVIFLKVDVDVCEDIAAEYSITAMPTFVFIKNGIKVAELKGANEDQLKEIVNTHKGAMNIQGEDF